MNTTRLNPLAEDYLRRLETAARVLPEQDREELLIELRGHLEAGLTADASDAEVRNLLRDLGPPEDIVSAAAVDSDAGSTSERPPTTQGAGVLPASPWGTVEILAVLGLTVGTFVVPIVGPLIGVCFVWASQRWTTREKVVATVLTFLPAIALALGAAVFVSGGPDNPVPSSPVQQHILGGLS